MSATEGSTDSRRTVNFWVDADLHRRIRVLAAHEEKPMAEWMREALLMVVENEEGASAET